MLERQIDMYVDFISPYSYLAVLRLTELKNACGCPVHLIPVNLPRLIKLSGNVPPTSVPNKARYLVRDLKRKARKQGCELRLIRPGGFDSRQALYIACALERQDRSRFIQTVFRHIWSGKVNVDEPEWLEAIAELEDFPASWRQLAGKESSRAWLQSNTEELLSAGGFGVPSFVLRYKGRRELFFGVDHMQDLMERCQELEGESS